MKTRSAAIYKHLRSARTVHSFGRTIRNLKDDENVLYLPVFTAGFLKTPTGIFWWLVASHIFQPPEKKDLQRHTWWLGGWLARWLGGWWLGGWWLVAELPGGWWLVAGVRLLVAVFFDKMLSIFYCFFLEKSQYLLHFFYTNIFDNFLSFYCFFIDNF